MEAQHVRDEETLVKLRELNDAIIAELGPVGGADRLDYPRWAYPRWAPGLGKDQITQKMRNERKKIELKNQRIIRDNEKLWKARSKIVSAREKVLLQSLGYPKGHGFYEGGYRHSERVFFNVEEVAVLP